jgi:hypothetical protein
MLCPRVAGEGDIPPEYLFPGLAPEASSGFVHRGLVLPASSTVGCLGRSAWTPGVTGWLSRRVGVAEGSGVMTNVDDDLRRVSELVDAAEHAIRGLDTDPAAGWGMIATERLEVVELLEQLGHPRLLVDSYAAPPDHDATEPQDPAALYDEAAAIAAGVDPAEMPRGLLVLLVQALTDAAAAARTVQRGPRSL